MIYVKLIILTKYSFIEIVVRFKSKINFLEKKLPVPFYFERHTSSGCLLA